MCAENPAGCKGGRLAGALLNLHLFLVVMLFWAMTHTSQCQDILVVFWADISLPHHEDGFMGADWKDKGVPASGAACAAGGRSRSAADCIRSHHTGRFQVHFCVCFFLRTTSQYGCDHHDVPNELMEVS